jgi:hypothetical protein
MVEHLTSKYKALSSNSSTTEKRLKETPNRIMTVLLNSKIDKFQTDHIPIFANTGKWEASQPAAEALISAILPKDN